jgi:hypothetical protein
VVHVVTRFLDAVESRDRVGGDEWAAECVCHMPLQGHGLHVHYCARLGLPPYPSARVDPMESHRPEVGENPTYRRPRVPLLTRADRGRTSCAVVAPRSRRVSDACARRPQTEQASYFPRNNSLSG